MASGICSGDVMAWYIRRKAPLVLGHEPAGIVAETRGEVGFSVGDRVFVHHHAPCFECGACSRGEYVQCATWRASKIDPGGIAEYFRVARENQRDTLALPPGVGFPDASLIEPLACVVKSLRRSGLRAGDRLYVIGLGVMGLLHVLAARRSGRRGVCERLHRRAPRDRRRQRCRRFSSRRRGPRARQTAPTSSSAVPAAPQAMHGAIAAAAPAGTVVMFTPFPPDVPITIDPERFYFSDLRLVASYSCGPDDTRAALELIGKGIVTAEKIGATLVSLDEVPRAYRELAESRIVKPIVTFG